MEYITITSDSYESAVNEAKVKYGERVRIHSRRDFTVGGGLFAKKRNKCEIVCYLAPERAVNNQDSNVTKDDLKEFEKEARTPDPQSLTLEEKLETNLKKKENKKLRSENHALKGGIRKKKRENRKPIIDKALKMAKELAVEVPFMGEVNNEN